MKFARKLVCLLLSICMVLSYASVASAAGGETNVKLEVNTTSVNVGDTVTVKITNADLTASGFGIYLEFDKELLVCTQITGADDDEYMGMYQNDRKAPWVTAQVADSVADTNKDGIFSFGVAIGSDKLLYEGTIATLTFTAQAPGTVTFILNEQTSGADDFKGVAATQDLTIKVNEPVHECTPGAVSYEKGTNGKHTVIVACADTTCDKIYSTTEEDCSDKTGDQDHSCDGCGEPDITKCADGNNDHDCDECGKELSKCSDKTGDRDHNCDVCGEPDITECSGGDATCLNKAVCSECGKEYGEKDSKNHVGKQTINYTDNGKDHTVTVTCECGSEISSKVVAHEYGEGFECVCEHKLAGWQRKGDAWYYVVDGKPVTGATRVPYPTIAINGVTYAANEEDKAFAQANAESKYSDAETAVFVFDKDGKFLQTTGIVDGNRYAVNGMIAWHVGLVKVDNNYYYFLGDVNGGGNIMATGKVYASRNTTDLNITKGGIYTFGDDGKMDLYDGIVNIDGTLYYYEETRLAIEAGLVEVDGGYYYVRSSGDRSGQLVVGRDYWVATTNGLLSAGMYTFADDGKIIMVEENEEYDGIVEIDNKLYYYVDGVRQVGAGVVQMTDEQGETFYIYVCSDGKLATGIYWPTIRNDLLEQGAYNWGTNGRYYPTKG